MVSALLQDFGEVENPTIPFDNVSSTDFLTLQKFMCGVPVKIDETNALSLVALANQFLVNGLESLGQDWIIDNAKLFDPFDVIVMAQKINLKQLELYFCWFLSTHFFEFQDSKGWKKLNAATRASIEDKKWPGKVYLEKREKWDQVYASAEKEMPSQKRVRENCVLQ